MVKHVRRLIIAVFTVMIMTVPALAGAVVNNNGSVRFGLTAVVVRENLRFLDQWAVYLGRKLNRRVEFVRRRSYREIMDMLSAGSLDFAWICGFPYIQKRDPEFLRLLSVPVYKGKPLYRSLFIVNSDSPYKTLDELKGKVFAFSDPESNSGFLYPQSVLAEKGVTADNFFRQTLFTFNHAETVEAVAEQVADGGAVDSYIWEYMKKFNPDIASKTRVIHQSPLFGFPPLVSRIGVDKAIVERMQQTLIGMKNDLEGRNLLGGLNLDSFGDFPPSLFDSIRKMAEKTHKAQTWLASTPHRSGGNLNGAAAGK